MHQYFYVFCFSEVDTPKRYVLGYIFFLSILQLILAFRILIQSVWSTFFYPYILNLTNVHNSSTQITRFYDSSASFNPFSTGADFRCQILTSKVDPRNERVKYLWWPWSDIMGIQMIRKELTKTFMMIWSTIFIFKQFIIFVFKELHIKVAYSCTGKHNDGYTFTRRVLLFYI